jgi:TPR repeat protein
MAPFEKACSSRLTNACSNICVAYLEGTSPKKAIEYLRRACDGGSAEACTHLQAAKHPSGAVSPPR